jgi:hypothetical protein
MAEKLRNYTVNPETGCWEWGGYVAENGYGRISDPSLPSGQKIQWAHRYFYRVHVGPIPERYEIDHECQNTICVNPAHLCAVSKPEHAARTFRRLGKDEKQKAAAVLRSTGLTYGEIAEALQYLGKESAHAAVQAAIRKGLVDPDDMPAPHRLSEQEKQDIRDLYALGIPQSEIAPWFRIDSSQVSRICNGRRSRAKKPPLAAA